MDHHFSSAYDNVMGGVAAGESVISGMKQELKQLFLNGTSARDAVNIIERWLPEGSWKWPEFEAQIHELGEWSAAETLWHRISRLAYAFRDEEKFKKSNHYAPYKLFSPVMDDRTPSECQALNGTVRRWNDIFWESHPVPCERLDCRCTWIQLSQRDFDRLPSKQRL